MLYRTISYATTPTQLMVRVDLFNSFPTHRERVSQVEFSIDTATAATSEEVPGLIETALASFGYEIEGTC